MFTDQQQRALVQVARSAVHQAIAGTRPPAPPPEDLAGLPAASGAFVTLHGSWNRSQRTGYKLIHLRPDGSYEDVIWGWALPDGTVWGRPVGATMAADGSLLISDDGAGVVWRLTYGLTPPTPSASP